MRRFYAVVLTFEILYGTLWLEDVLSAFSLAPDGEEFLCEWVAIGIFDFNLYIGVIMAVLGTAVSHGFDYANSTAKKLKWLFWAFDCVMTPIFCLVAAELVMAMAKYIFRQ